MSKKAFIANINLDVIQFGQQPGLQMAQGMSNSPQVSIFLYLRNIFNFLTDYTI
jgi:hypothetical protein